MKRFPQTEGWMKYAIKRTNQIINENDLYQFDTSRIQEISNQLGVGLDTNQLYLLGELAHYSLCREDDITLAVYMQGFADALNLIDHIHDKMITD